MSDQAPDAIEMVPIEHITVINPRARNKKVFREIVDNIADIGLKRPITVARRQTPAGRRYDLVCGQGRLEAFRTKKASIVTASTSDPAVCEELCSLASDICDVKEKLCDLADERPDDDQYQGLCREAKNECQEAQESCVRCVESNK